MVVVKYLVGIAVALVSFLLGAFIESIYFDRTYAVRELQDSPLYAEMFPALPRPSQTIRDDFDQLQVTTEVVRFV